MSSHIATLTSPDSLPLSPEAQDALGLHVGSQVNVTIEQGKMTVEPATVDDQPGKPLMTRAEFDAIVADMRSMFAGEPSLEDEYFRDRDKDKW